MGFFSREQAIEVPPCPDDYAGRAKYMSETLAMVEQMSNLTANVLKFREFNRLNRTVDLRLKEVDKSIARVNTQMLMKEGI